MEDTETSVRAIHDLTLQSVAAQNAEMPLDGESAPYVVVPEEHRVCSLEHLLPGPIRPRGTIVASGARAFVRLFAELKDETSRIYAVRQPEPVFVAVLNDHAASEHLSASEDYAGRLSTGAPGWRDHRIEYRCPLSVEWQTWKSSNKKAMTQADFAQFIEDNAPDIRDPGAGPMIEIARSIEAKKDVRFASAIRLSDGSTQFTYEEEVQGSAAKGQMAIPEIFTLGIAVFDGGDGYEVTARLRYRIDHGTLKLWYDLLRPHKILEDAAQGVWNQIELESDVSIIFAAAPAPLHAIG